MRAVVQRVTEASVFIDDKLYAQIGAGLLVFIGIEEEDTDEDMVWLCNKIVQLRIMDDANGVMNLSVKDAQMEILAVSQFTLHASIKKGNRPSYIRAAKPELANQVYHKVIHHLESRLGRKIATGIFGAMMKVALVNDGPVTIWIDTKQKE